MDTDTTALAAVLRKLLESIDADEIDVTEQQRDYLTGAADALGPTYEASTRRSS